MMNRFIKWLCTQKTIHWENHISDMKKRIEGLKYFDLTLPKELWHRIIPKCLNKIFDLIRNQLCYLKVHCWSGYWKIERCVVLVARPVTVLLVTNAFSDLFLFSGFLYGNFHVKYFINRGIVVGIFNDYSQIHILGELVGMNFHSAVSQTAIVFVFFLFSRISIFYNISFIASHPFSGISLSVAFALPWQSRKLPSAWLAKISFIAVVNFASVIGSTPNPDLNDWIHSVI